MAVIKAPAVPVCAQAAIMKARKEHAKTAKSARNDAQM